MPAPTAVATTLNLEPNASVVSRALDTFTAAAVVDIAAAMGGGDTSASGITAGTTRTQAGATALTKTINRVDTSTAPAAGAILGDGVKLPAAAAGIWCQVINNTVNPVQVYGAGTDTVNGIAAATGVPLPPGDVAFIVAAATGGWQFDAGMGASGSLPVVLAASGITAGTTRTQAGATALVADMNRVDTSTAPAAGSTIGDGVKLPASAMGLDVVVVNNTVNPVQVYGAGTDTVNGIAAATGVPLPPGGEGIYACAAAGSWQVAAGVGSSGRLTLELAADALTAAGTTQGTATQLVAQLNNVATVAANTGVNLPSSAPGLIVVVQNNGLNALLVYPFQGATDTINGIVASLGVSLHPGTTATFNCTATGAWTTEPASPVTAVLNLVTSADANMTLTAAQASGGVSCVDAQVQAGVSITAGRTLILPTVASLILALHAPTVGTSFRLRLTNAQGGNFSLTTTTNTGWTLTGGLAGSHAIPQNTWREYVVTITSVSGATATAKSVANGTFS